MFRQVLNSRQSNGDNMKIHSLKNLQVTLMLSLKSYKASMTLIHETIFDEWHITQNMDRMIDE